MEPVPGHRRLTDRRGYFAVVLTLAFLIQLTGLGFGRFAYTVLLPGMKADLSLSNTHMGFIQVAILLGYLIFAYLCCILAKRWSLAATVNISVAVVGIAMIALGVVSSFWLVLVLAFWMGAGAVGSYIPLLPLLIGWSSTRRSGSAIGIALSGTGVGILLTGYVASFVLTRYGPAGWRWGWIVLGAATLLVALAGSLLLREKEGPRLAPEESDGAGAVLSLLYRDPALRAIMAVYVLVGFGYIMYGTFIVAYAIEEVRFSTEEAGLLWALFGLFSIAGCAFWGIVSDRLGRRIVNMIALSLLAASVVLAILWTTRAGLYLSGSLFAFTFNGAITLIAVMFGDRVPTAKMDRFFGTATLVHALAQAIGVAIAGWLKDATATFVVPFIVSALIIALCPVFLAFMKERGGGGTAAPGR